MTSRRDSLLTLAAIAASPRALAQSKPAPGKPLTVGILSTADPANRQLFEKMLLDAMRDLGWMEGKNIVYDRAHADGDIARLPAAAAALASRNPRVIQASNNSETLAAFSKAGTIPIVFAAVADPVAIGLVKSLSHPGGNVTGVANIGWELGGKRLQLLQQAMPKLARVGVLLNPSQSAINELKLIDQAGAKAGVKVTPVMVKQVDELEAAFAAFTKARVEAVLGTHVVFLLSERKSLLDLAAKHRVPLVAHRSEMADDGALISYSSMLSEHYRRVARMIDKILNGAKPADIPVEQPTRFELVVNMKTARALKLTIPAPFLAQADRVIE